MKDFGFQSPANERDTGPQPLANSPAAVGTGQAGVLHTAAVLWEGLGLGTAARKPHA